MTATETRPSSRARNVTNWVLALLTIPAAVALVLSEGQFTGLLYASPVRCCGGSNADQAALQLTSCR